MRIYKVTNPAGVRLIRAANQPSAIRFVALSTIRCEVASQDDLVELTACGVKVEESGLAPVSHPDADGPEPLI